MSEDPDFRHASDIMPKRKDEKPRPWNRDYFDITADQAKALPTCPDCGHRVIVGSTRCYDENGRFQGDCHHNCEQSLGRCRRCGD